MLPITKKNTALLAISILLTLVGEPILIRHSPAIADNTIPTTPTKPAPFPLPTSVSSGSQVRVDGSSSMKNINEALEKQFESKFSGTEVTLSESGTDQALQALREGKIDLAAIGRPLTPAEQAEGFKQYAVTRHKIAMIVGPENPFNQSLTIEQFAQIFRGEIKDWSKVGGVVGVIRVIDRPATSDTRQAFNNYPVFQKAPLKTGDNAKTVADDQTDLVIAELGKDGIGYAIADQVEGRTDVKILKMHETLPNDERYPFSQPLIYVYKGAAPSDAAKAFLGYATAPDNATVIEDARRADVAPAPVPAETTTTTVPTTTEPDRDSGFPWWLLLLAPLLLIPFFLRGRSEPEPEVIRDPIPAPPPPPPTPVAAPVAPSRLILTPRDCRNAYAYWEVPSERFAQLRGDGRKLVIRLYDATDINLDDDHPHRVEEYECNEWDQDLHIPIAVDNRDYVAELGYVTDQVGEWYPIAKSDAVRVPACQPQINTPTTAAGASAAAGAIALNSLSAPETGRILLTPRSCTEAYVYWEIPDEHKAALRNQGGEKLMLRIYDATDLDLDEQPPHAVEEYQCSEYEQDKHVPISVDDRDYVAELGYQAADGSWYRLARSLYTRVPACEPVAPVNPLESELITNVPTATGLVQTGSEKANNFDTSPDIFADLFDTDHDKVDEVSTSETVPTDREKVNDFFDTSRDVLADLFDTGRDKVDEIRSSDTFKSGSATVAASSAAIAAGLGAAVGGVRDFFDGDETKEGVQDKITLRWRNSEEAFVSWRVSDSEKEILRQNGGQRLALRVYDLTDTNLDGQPDSVWEYECEEFETEKIVRIYGGDRNYVAELGYLTEEGRWLPLAKSNVLKVE
ncbi:DUF4912 domain-containing protein [Chroococcus sp. FPU101]|uniref:DUF4912 domain-containing protein n=1 Tax=Chroococcus sp. FPU101 TaxID=1974212 RepID=UPI001A90609A|nr:DUF4912 domain-containing protein [Chroococcus sp. FPU101]GFE69506.1 hypothetical protein CFPU101_21160 [Chroococcus sp. FPU101]